MLARLVSLQRCFLYVLMSREASLSSLWPCDCEESYHVDVVAALQSASALLHVVSL